jgi:hypothetical protein
MANAEAPPNAEAGAAQPATAAATPEAEEEAEEGEEDAAPPADGETATNEEGTETATAKPHHAYNPNARSRFLDLQVGIGIGSRRLDLHGLTTANLSSYRLPAAPIVLLGATFAPWARSKVKILKDSYAYASLTESIGVQSYDSFAQTSYDTRWSAWEAGVAVRSRTSDWGPVIGGKLGYGNETFAIQEGAQLVTQQPSTSYSYLALAFVLDQPVARWLRFEMTLGYRAVFSPGYLGDRFANTQVSGLNANLAFRLLVLPKGFTLRLVAQYVAYFYRITSGATDPYIATGAVDQYVTAGVMATWGL